MDLICHSRSLHLDRCLRHLSGDLDEMMREENDSVLETPCPSNR